MDVVNSQQGGDPNVVPAPTPSTDAEVPKMDMERTLPRQVSTGNLRGTQNITGQQTISEPNTGNPVITTSGPNQQQLFTDPISSINYMVQGKIGDKSYGIKVAKPGIDVLNATDEQLIFNSGQNVLKIVDTGTTVIPGFSTTSAVGQFAVDDAEVFVVHNLGYVPVVLAYVFRGGFYQAIPTYQFITGSSSGFINLGVYANTDTTTVAFSQITSSYNEGSFAVAAVDIKYYLLQETAN